MKCPSVTSVVLLACGSFNPITNMHLRMFELARDHLEDTGQYRVLIGIISPVGDGYKKKGLIEVSQRQEMARLATENSDWIAVGFWESMQPDWVETVEVIRHYYDTLFETQQESDETDTFEASSPQNRSDGPQVMLLCGADFLESFGVPDLWKEEDIEEIVGDYGLVCITRTGYNPYKFIHKSDVLWKHRRNIHLVHECVTNDISATHMRRALRRGQSSGNLLPDAVVSYIQQNNLYSAESEQKNADVVLEPLQRNSGDTRAEGFTAAAARTEV
ncbi:nicotinamide/nicotinic acid mononucleotide adenylyltransferase 1 [Pleuronectes platessa]|uniref:nicotinamide/nicotinic acid mononucleotide adenylyltransferase 1 n=1 Tax=Pleuronectes platessa TaxID=8262 RepID=UPI00232A483B|nr:nicotinamide/nicotinic acid mononucleotide adenylyltransferase 1 [Pleuronectes platessa]XP_053280040.1 nicotinamide/nicotinic acid mononucleotide adenylyltransferase 1 [Pleuronectes platessa]